MMPKYNHYLYVKPGEDLITGNAQIMDAKPTERLKYNRIAHRT